MKILAQVLSVVVASFFALAVNGATLIEQIQLDQLSPSDQRYFHLLEEKDLNSDKTKKTTVNLAKSDFSPFPGFPGLGSMDRALNDYAVPRSTGIAVGVYQDTANGPIDVSDPIVRDISCSTTNEINGLLQSFVREIVQKGSENPLVDKNGFFNVFSYTSDYSPRIGGVLYLRISNHGFRLIKKSDGSYEIPDLSDLKFRLVDSVIYELPLVSYLRAQVTYPKTPKTSPLIVDTRIHASGSGGIEFSMEPGASYIQIRTTIATAGTNGSTRLDLELGMNDSGVLKYGPFGEQLPNMTGLKVLNERVTFNLTWDKSRAMIVDSSPSPDGPWTYASTLLVPHNASYARFEGLACGQNGFYRLTEVSKETLSR